MTSPSSCWPASGQRKFAEEVLKATTSLMPGGDGAPKAAAAE